jgi:hypothetical protein
MQTFLPYPDFLKSAQCLDRARLGKQRIETKQLVMALTLPKYGWKSHPAARMWEGYTLALCVYGAVMSREWIKRGYKDAQLTWFNNAYCWQHC